jgi:hypothetical protein
LRAKLASKITTDVLPIVLGDICECNPQSLSILKGFSEELGWTIQFPGAFGLC